MATKKRRTAALKKAAPKKAASRKAAPKTSARKKAKRMPAAPAGAHRKIRVLASRTLSSLDAVARQMQGLASCNAGAARFDNLGGDALAKHMAVVGVLAALIERRAKPTFIKKGWAGTISGDYRFTEMDFSPFLDLVSAALLPAFHFDHDASFDRQELADTLGGLASSIEDVTTP